MKLLNNSLSIFILFVTVLGTVVSCDDDDKMGEPEINYIRVTDPEKSDSLLLGGFLGNLVVLSGKNLSSIQEVWFNDQKATIIPTFVTNTSVFVNIPDAAPTEVNNQLTAIFSSGFEITKPFVIEIPAPQVNAMKNEYAPIGSDTEIYGNYFFEPLSVMFTGGVQADVSVPDENTLQVTVPEGALPGPVTVMTNFGETVSTFWYRDNRYVFGSMDTPTDGWWHGQNYLDPVPEIPQIDNNYVYIDQQLDQDQWFEWYVGEGGGILEGTQNIPDDAIINPDRYNLKFEINTLSPWVAGTAVRMYIGNAMSAEREANNYNWTLTEPINTDNEWQTVTTEFDGIINANPAITLNPDGYQLSFWFWQGAAMHANFAIDNLRVSPK